MSRKRITIPFSDIEVLVTIGEEVIKISVKGLKSFVSDENGINKKKVAEYYTRVLGTNVSRRTLGRRIVEMNQLNWSDMLREDLMFSINLRKAKEEEYVRKIA